MFRSQVELAGFHVHTHHSTLSSAPSQDLAFKFLAKATSNHSRLKALPLNPWGSHWLSLWGQGFSPLDYFTVSKDICRTNL